LQVRRNRQRAAAMTGSARNHFGTIVTSAVDSSPLSSSCLSIFFLSSLSSVWVLSDFGRRQQPIGDDVHAETIRHWFL